MTIVPYQVEIAGQRYKENEDIKADEALKIISRQSVPPKIIPPSMDDYIDIYTRLAHTHDAIISIHSSREMFTSWQHARDAAEQLAGHCKIAVIDSRTIGPAQALLVRAAIRAIDDLSDFDAIVRHVRGAVDRLFSTYFVETVDYLQNQKVMSPSHTILGALLGIKPLLAVEEGELVAIEKVKTRTQAIERLCEFAVEFTDVEDAVILHGVPAPNDQLRTLQDRLAEAFDGRTFPTMLYDVSLAALIGTDATGVVILEEDLGGFEDDFQKD